MSKKRAHVQIRLQAVHSYVCADEHVDGVRYEADGVAEQVEQSQSWERNRCLQLTALRQDSTERSWNRVNRVMVHDI